jgi:hypothetical protein
MLAVALVAEVAGEGEAGNDMERNWFRIMNVLVLF